MLTGRLVTLRALEPDDAKVLAAYLNDVEVELLGGGDPPRPQPLASVTEMLDGLRGDKDAVNFAIVADERTIGWCGLFRPDPVAGTAELGITIGERDYWGHGYGRDAVSVLVDYGFRLRNLRKIWLRVHASNARAISSYAAVGFVEEGRQLAHVWTDGGYDDLVLMARFRGADHPDRTAPADR